MHIITTIFILMGISIIFWVWVKKSQKKDKNKVESIKQNMPAPLQPSVSKKAISSPICPYCKNTLEKRPQRKKKCPSCGNIIYIRKDKLITEEEAQKIKKEYEKKYEIVNKIRLYNSVISEQDFINRRNLLLKKYGFIPSDKDIIGSLLNEDLHHKCMEGGNYFDLKLAYLQLAIFHNKEGGPWFELLQQSRKMDLLERQKSLSVFQKIPTVQIYVIAHSRCEACKKLKNKILTIEEALREMPIPCKECTTILYDKSRGFCECSYQAYDESW